MLRSLGQKGSPGRQLRPQLRSPLSPPCSLCGCLSSLSCNLLLCPAGLSLAAELTLVQRKWDWCFVRGCFSLFLWVGIELQRQRALTEDGVSGEMSNAGPDCSAVIKHLREDVPGRGMLTLWSWTDSSSFNYSFHLWNLLCTFDQLWDFFPPFPRSCWAALLRADTFSTQVEAIQNYSCSLSQVSQIRCIFWLLNYSGFCKVSPAHLYPV